MKQYKMIVSYDGTDFCGWAPQIGKASISGTLEEAFLKTFHKPIVVLGASRTDAGVHAMGQVAIFKTDIDVDIKTMQWAWHNTLPSSILIRSIEQDDSFNPYRNVDKKTYYYHITTERPLPFAARYVLYHTLPFNEQAVKEALHIFVGTHDFNAFYTGSDKGSDTVRIIDSITLEFIPQFGMYRISVVGQRFLRHMVRRIVGAALAIASGKTSRDVIVQALQTRNIVFSLPTAPAHGLMLYQIVYGDTHE